MSVTQRCCNLNGIDSNVSSTAGSYVRDSPQMPDEPEHSIHSSLTLN